MSKDSKIHTPSDSLEDASENLDKYDLSKAVRGKYYAQYQALKGKIPVTIEIEHGEKKVILHTIKTKAILDQKGSLKADIGSDLAPGEYEVTITIEERQNDSSEIMG